MFAWWTRPRHRARDPRESSAAESGKIDGETQHVSGTAHVRKWWTWRQKPPLPRRVSVRNFRAWKWCQKHRLRPWNRFSSGILQQRRVLGWSLEKQKGVERSRWGDEGGVSQEWGWEEGCRLYAQPLTYCIFLHSQPLLPFREPSLTSYFYTPLARSSFCSLLFPFPLFPHHFSVSLYSICCSGIGSGTICRIG